MSDKDTKAFRKDLRKVVEQLLPDTLSHSHIDALRKEVFRTLDLRFEVMSKNFKEWSDGQAEQIKKRLAEIDARSKAVQDHVIRVTTAPAPVEATTPPGESL